MSNKSTLILGLTGSIGMGKTTTAQMFADEGCPVFDADKAVHSLYAKGGKAVDLIRAVFPDAVKDGSIDRSVLGQYMRDDPLNLKVLESFIHPWVGALRQEFLEAAIKNNAEIVVFDVPLLFETGGDQYVDYTLVVSAPESIQRQRVMARPGMNEDLFKQLLSRQMPDVEKRKRADFILSTAQDLSETRKQVQALLKKLRTQLVKA
ncbi:dephospho-CoA kinase [Litorimonas taeanensis]|uniref:Dephospho-CoA kinase n=1 Tax=Litorimonas taeanensis TaxID=568099 RepID=A0A420WEH8_9PROT|nr:dephospho-CoA kinase [Litorimonas taeanensis]RKQ69437.1 dephospho-CoA kinase [Litorimonas taeanensis]